MANLISLKELKRFDPESIAEIWLICSACCCCPGCDQIKMMLASDIESGNITVIDVTDEKAQKMMTRLGIDEIPSLLYEMNDGSLLQVV